MIADLKPYPSMKDSNVSWLGDVPEHWEVRRLRNAADMRVSNVDKHTKDDEESVRLCNYVDVYKNDRIRSGIPFMRATATVDEIERFRLRTGDVLITKDSEAWNDIGVPALVEHPADDLISGYHLALLRPVPERVQGSFLFRAIQSTGVAYQFHVEANGVTRYGLSHRAIKSTWVPVPPLPEQVGIIRFLDYVDRRIRRYIRAKQKLIKLLEEHKQAITHQAVTRGLDSNVRLKPSGVAWLGDIPQHWEVRRIKNFLREVDERSTTGHEPLLSVRMHHGVVLFAEHFARPPQAATLLGFKVVHPGQFVVNRMQAGNGVVFASDLMGLVSPDYGVFEPLGDANVAFVGELLRSPTVRAKLRAESKGLGTGSSGFLRLYSDRMGAIHVAMPSGDEQESIVAGLAEILADANTAVSRLNREVELLREYRTRFIADVVTGKLDVREAAARLPDEGDEPDVVDEVDEGVDAGEASDDEFDAVLEGVEA